jgi:hypothetical protein
MTELEFDEKMERYELDSEYFTYICEHYDTWSEYKVISIMDSGDAYDDFKEYMVYGKGSK